MMTTLMSIASYAMAVGGGGANLDIFSKDFGEPRQLEFNSKLQCKFDNAQISYFTNSDHHSTISKIKINNLLIKKEKLDYLNRIIGGNEVQLVKWMRCPESKKSNSPVVAYIFTSIGNPIRFFEVHLDRNSSISVPNNP